MSQTITADLPAVAGGTPARTTPYGREARYGEEELRELAEALAQGTLFYAQGQKVRQLEEAFAASCGVGYAVACSSGTAAIHAALQRLLHRDGASPLDVLSRHGRDAAQHLLNRQLAA